MYTRTTDPTHIIQEVIDNAADEALGGPRDAHRRLRVHADQSVTVQDDGRGIPVGPASGGEGADRRARVHAAARGRQVRQDGRPGAYAFSGGLHGVGVSVTNALSQRLEVEVKRDGKVHRIVFAGGDVAEKLKVDRQHAGARARGTTVRVLSRSEVLRFARRLAAGARAAAARQGGAAARREGDAARREGQGGEDAARGRIRDGLEGLSRGAAPTAPSRSRRSSPARRISASRAKATRFAEGEGAAWAFAWYEDGSGEGESYVNLIPTAAGGTHEAGHARGAVRRGQVVRRPSRPAAARRAPADRGRLGQAALRAVGAHPRSAVPGPGEGEAHAAATR